MKECVLAYNLDAEMQTVSGTASFREDGAIIAVLGGEIILRLSAEQVEEASVLAGVGCGLIFLKMKDGAQQVLCRFTMTQLGPAGEFCKVVNYFIQTGIAAIEEEKQQRVCEKCGRPLIEDLSVCLFCYNKMGVIARAIGLMKPYVKQILSAEILLLVSSILFLLVPVFNRILIDEYLEPQTGLLSQVMLLAGAMLLSRGLGEGMFILSSRMFNKSSMLFANRLRTLAYEKIQRMSMTSLAKRTPGDLIRRVMEDTQTIKDFLSDGGRWAVEQILMFVIVMVILLFTDPKMTLLVFLPVPVVMLALSRFWRFIHIRYERQWRKNSRCQSILHDIIKGIRTVKSFGNEEREIEKFSKATRELAQVSSSNEQMWSLLFPAMIFFTGIGEFLVLYFGGKDILAGKLSMGILVQFTMYVAYIYGPLRWLVSFPRWLAEALTSMIKTFEILDEEVEIADTEDSLMVPIRGEVAFENVSFGYKSYEPVLKDVTLDIRPGEMVGIVGRSGAGKSTLMNLLMRLYDPGVGHIRINGTDLRDMDPAHLHENIGVVFQETFLFAGTIYDNIAYAKPGARPEEVLAAAKASGAHDFIMQTADGYNTVIGENGHSISGGERQRLSIARAIIKDPDILILDEATSSLDVETEKMIQDSLAKLVKGRTTIAIAHRLSTLRSADRLVVLDKGSVAEIGTHMELLRQKGIYYRLVMAQRQTSKIAPAETAEAPA